MPGWSKRFTAGVSLVGAAALSFKPLFGYVVPTLLGLIGIFIMVWDWRASKAAPKEARLSTEFITEDLDKSRRRPTSFPIYTKENVLTGEVPFNAGFLLVHNTGASPIKCHAIVSVSSGMPDWPKEVALAYWHEGRSSHITIESGGTRKIIIAALQVASMKYRWSIPCWLQGKPRSIFTESFYNLQKTTTAHADVHISIIVKSEPFPADELPQHSFRLDGQEIKVATD